MPEDKATILKGNLSFTAWRARVGRGAASACTAVAGMAANIDKLEWSMLLEPLNFVIWFGAFLVGSSTSAKASTFGKGK